MHVAECSLIGIYDTFADSFGWHNALHMCVWCAQKSWCNVCVLFVFSALVPIILILFYVNVKLWFGFSFLKKLSRCFLTRTSSAFLRSYFTN